MNGSFSHICSITTTGWSTVGYFRGRGEKGGSGFCQNTSLKMNYLVFHGGENGQIMNIS